MELNKLPHELLEKVLSHLPWYCLPEKALVSKQWYTIIKRFLKRHHGTDLVLREVAPELLRFKCTIRLAKPVPLEMYFDRSAHLRKLRVLNILHPEIVAMLTQFGHQTEYLEELDVQIYSGDNTVGVGPTYISLPNLRSLRFVSDRKQADYVWRLAWMYVLKAPRLQDRTIIEQGYRRLLFIFVDEPIRNRGLITRLRTNCMMMLNYLLIVFLYLLWQ